MNMTIVVQALRKADEEFPMSLEIQAYSNVVEIARLTNKIPLLIHSLGGLLPGLPDKGQPAPRKVLEVACGPGGGCWNLQGRIRKLR
ncbi:hypothetical protein EPA93_45250 [Ktedonosporobacter rubrisoli]|uniref:Uncharacterized protein n=1 Tax=Ktedonosporobacter rubrisoli TaxID=2509675 RepID=A0A4P6K4D7_KTERU|nr:hypothetical protein [Ktedonosporobacter rubrisoli]QBD82793.1 hypothetical protein EPA93_45250 [Ktedonosporobacter rubrisoli]